MGWYSSILNWGIFNGTQFIKYLEIGGSMKCPDCKKPMINVVDSRLDNIDIRMYWCSPCNLHMTITKRGIKTKGKREVYIKD